MLVHRIAGAGLLLAAAFAVAPAGQAAEPYELVISNNAFQPAELHVPAGKKVTLTVRNEDPTPEEFESYELNREKVVPGGATATIYVGPLDAGRYPFFGDFHQDTAKGTLIAD